MQYSAKKGDVVNGEILTEDQNVVDEFGNKMNKVNYDGSIDYGDRKGLGAVATTPLRYLDNSTPQSDLDAAARKGYDPVKITDERDKNPTELIAEVVKALKDQGKK